MARLERAARSLAKSRWQVKSRRGLARQAKASGRCVLPGIARWKICIPRGSRRFSMIHSMRRHRGRHCMRCCAIHRETYYSTCLLYTSDAADDLLCVDLGGRRIIKKKKNTKIAENTQPQTKKTTQTINN